MSAYQQKGERFVPEMLQRLKIDFFTYLDCTKSWGTERWQKSIWTKLRHWSSSYSYIDAKHLWNWPLLSHPASWYRLFWSQARHSEEGVTLCDYTRAVHMYTSEHLSYFLCVLSTDKVYFSKVRSICLAWSLGSAARTVWWFAHAPDDANTFTCVLRQQKISQPSNQAIFS